MTAIPQNFMEYISDRRHARTLYEIAVTLVIGVMAFTQLYTRSQCVIDTDDYAGFKTVNVSTLTR